MFIGQDRLPRRLLETNALRGLMLKDIKVRLENRPGTLADLGEALGETGVNIEGLCGPCEMEGVAHILVDDVKSARIALEKAGFEVIEEGDVLVLDVKDKPGELGNVCRRIADAGINIDFFYAATRTRVVLGVDDIEKAKSVL
jgi:hypothetical protein